MDGKTADLKPDVKLQPHQEQALARGTDSDHARLLLYHSLGSGKGLTSISIGERAGGPYTAVVPAALRQTYKKEQERFTDQRTPSDVLSYTQVAQGKPVTKLDTLIADEAHRLRDPASQQARAFHQVADKARRLLLLTGSPVVNRPGDLAEPLSLLTGQKISPEDFEKRYLGSKKVWPGILPWLRGVPVGKEPVVAHPEELKALLQGHVDYYEAPKSPVPVNQEDVHVDMSPEQSRLYSAMWGRLPWLLRWKLKRQYPLTDEELRKATSFLTGPRQVGLSTYPFMGQGADPLKAFAGSPKLQAAWKSMQETLQDPRAKAIVHSNFIDAGLRPYAAQLAQAGIPHAMFHGGLSDAERRQLVEDFNANKLRVALVGPSGAEGISLKGSQLQQILDPYWNPGRSQQQVGRGLRYDSHLGLPDELKKMRVQRFVARLPLGLKDRLLASLGLDQSAKQRAADEHLRALSAKKEQRNRIFLDLLREVGSEKRSADATSAAGKARPTPGDAAGAANPAPADMYRWEKQDLGEGKGLWRWPIQFLGPRPTLLKRWEQATPAQLKEMEPDLRRAVDEYETATRRDMTQAKLSPSDEFLPDSAVASYSPAPVASAPRARPPALGPAGKLLELLQDPHFYIPAGLAAGGLGAYGLYRLWKSRRKEAGACDVPRGSDEGMATSPDPCQARPGDARCQALTATGIAPQAVRPDPAMLARENLRGVLRQINKQTQPSPYVPMAKAAESPLPLLLAAKAESDRGNYPAKHRIMRQLIKERPNEFHVDGLSGPVVSVTHTPTGFRMHLPAHVVPTRLPMRPATLV